MRYLLISALAACAEPDVLEARQLPAAVRGDAAAAVAANNAFACDLYKAASADAPANLILSPFSLSTLLAMLDAGAAGDTDSQLRAALHATLDSDATNTAYGALIDSLRTGAGYGAYDLQIAARLFGQQGFPFLPSYLATTKQDFGAELAPVDFAGDPGGATESINGYVDDVTDGHIPTLFQDGDLDSSTVLAAVNAIHFKGAWDTEFSPASPGTFTRADGSTIDAMLMSRVEPADLRVSQLDGVIAASLPFKGQDLSFVVAIPEDAANLSALEAGLTADQLASWAPNDVAPPGHFDLIMPKFTIATALDGAPLLRKLGVTDAFDDADFSRIDGTRALHLQAVRHSATIAVDEQGAEATAASGGGYGVVSAPPRIELVHPFLFLIRDNVTGAVLFIGRVGDPTLE